MLASKTAFSKESFNSEDEANNVTFCCPCEPRPKMLTTFGISSFDNSLKSRGDSPAKPEWPAKNIWPSGASPVSKCLSDLHQMNRCPSIRPNAGSQLHVLDDVGVGGWLCSAFFSFNSRAPCHLAFHSLSRRAWRFVIANFSRYFSPRRRASQKYVLRKSSSVGMDRNKFSSGLPLSVDDDSSVATSFCAVFFLGCAMNLM